MLFPEVAMPQSSWLQLASQMTSFLRKMSRIHLINCIDTMRRLHSPQLDPPPLNPPRLNPPLIAARSFEAAARHGSFQRAAQELHVTPTAISHQVKRLEAYLGAKLFARTKGLVVLTPEGAALAVRLGEHFVGLERSLDPAAFSARHPLRVTAMPSLAAKWLAQRLAQYQSLHPSLPVVLSDDDEVVSFKDGRFDLALRYGNGDYPHLTVHAWMEAPVLAVCSPALQSGALPLSAPADVLKHTLIADSTVHLPGKPPGWPEWLAAHRLQAAAGQQVLSYASVYIALEAARDAMGIALAPEPLVRDDLRSGKLIAPFELVLDNPYAFWIVHPAHLASDPRVQTLIDWLHACR